MHIYSCYNIKIFIYIISIECYNNSRVSLKLKS